MNPSLIASLLIGTALLLLGRRLFWLFVGGIGFLAGAKAGAEWLLGAGELVVFGVALLAGVVGAVAAIFLQKLVAALAGLLAGGYLAHLVAASTGHDPSSVLPFIVGGLVGALLMLALFDWGLIGLSVLLGAATVVDSLSVSGPLAGLLLVGLIVLGAVFQTKDFEAVRHRKPSSTAA